MVVGRDKHVELKWRGPSEKQRGAGDSHPFPLPRCPHTRKERLTNRYPNTLCSICFSPSIGTASSASAGPDRARAPRHSPWQTRAEFEIMINSKVPLLAHGLGLRS